MNNRAAAVYTCSQMTAAITEGQAKCPDQYVGPLMVFRPISRSLHTDRHNGRCRCMCALNVFVLYTLSSRLLNTSYRLLVPSTGPVLEVAPQSDSISWERVSTDSRRCGILLSRFFWPACWYLH